MSKYHNTFNTDCNYIAKSSITKSFLTKHRFAKGATPKIVKEEFDKCSIHNFLTGNKLNRAQQKHTDMVHLTELKWRVDKRISKF